jgi:DNA-binding winged helix-turn-helix (wHTH) protein
MRTDGLWGKCCILIILQSREYNSGASEIDGNRAKIPRNCGEKPMGIVGQRMVKCITMKAGNKPLVFSKAPRTFTFGGHTLDLDRGSLTRGAEELKLRPKSYETLRFLVENAGRLVPKAELIAVLWPDAIVVSEDSLTHCIMDVRRALEDHGQQIIRTLPGRGYLFAAPIQTRGDSVEALPPPADNHPAWRIPKPAAIGLVLALVIIAGLGLLLRARGRRKWVHESVARVEELAAAGKYAESYDVALQVLSREPAEPRITSLMSELSDDLSVTTKPPGAERPGTRISSERFRARSNASAW